MAAQKNLKLTLEYDKASDVSAVKTDEQRLAQVLSNLVRNAINFTPKGSIQFGFMRSQHHLQFFVSDTGIGIPQEQHEKVFEQFMQADNSLTRTHDGTGLGLSISRALVHALGGSIWLESEEDVGTTMYFTIPYFSEYPAPKKENEATIHIEGFNGQKVLLAEDDAVNTIYMQKVLESMNLQVVHAETGREAVLKAETHGDINIVLMDIKMPDMNGYEATEIIKKKRPEVIIIGQSAHAYPEDREKGMEAGFSTYLSKPVSRDMLYEALKKHLQPL